MTMGMDRAVSTATGLHHRKPHSHTCSCLLDVQPTCPQGHTHWSRSCWATHPYTATRQLSHTSFLQFSLSGITCPDNPATCAQHNCPGLTTHLWEFSCHCNSHHVHGPHTLFTLELTSAVVSGSLVQRARTFLGHVTSQRDCPQPSRDRTTVQTHDHHQPRSPKH